MCTLSILNPLIIALNVLTRSIKDALKALFDLALYPLNCIALVELGTISPLFALVVKDEQRGAVEDTTIVVTQVTRCDKNVKAFRRVDNLHVWWIWCDEDKAMRDVKEMDGMEAIMIALASNDNKEELEAPR
ncbi:unnamed protein product [Musa acuminata subsp. burmannicoides]